MIILSWSHEHLQTHGFRHQDYHSLSLLRADDKEMQACTEVVTCLCCKPKREECCHVLMVVDSGSEHPFAESKRWADAVHCDDAGTHTRTKTDFIYTWQKSTVM